MLNLDLHVCTSIFIVLISIGKKTLKECLLHFKTFLAVHIADLVAAKQRV